MTTKDEIRQWLKDAPEGATHMLVCWDKFDNTDYPVYPPPGADTQATKAWMSEWLDSKDRDAVQEVYALHLDHEMQLRKPMSWSVDFPTPAEDEKPVEALDKALDGINLDEGMAELRKLVAALVEVGAEPEDVVEAVKRVVLTDSVLSTSSTGPQEFRTFWFQSRRGDQSRVLGVEGQYGLRSQVERFADGSIPDLRLPGGGTTADREHEVFEWVDYRAVLDREGGV